MRSGGGLATLLVVAMTSLPAQAAQDGAAVLFDRTMTVGAGAAVTASLGETLARAEDAIVPARLFGERGVWRRVSNITYRFGKLVLFDLPQEQWLTVMNHEVMGHGARLRERFDDAIRYRIAAPPPYGPGGGVTFFRLDRPPTAAELLAIAVAGMEADAVAARVVAEGAFQRGQMRVRDALRYLGFELDTLDYISRTGDALEEEGSGHDVAQFLQVYRDIATAAGAPALRPRTLRREALASLANPMLVFAAYGIGRYVWNGTIDVAVPTVSIGGVRYMPLVRYQLTPYGTEWAVTNHLAGRRWPTRVEMRFGRAPGTRPWGLGVERRDLARWQSWRFDVGIEIWRQPNVASRTDSVLRPLQAGVELRGRAERPLLSVWRSTRRATVIVDVGIKTAGFIPGEPLRAGLIVRFGVGFPVH
jgi:hypothetical protein